MDIAFVAAYPTWDYVAVFVCGLIVGSFLNVVILRLRSGISFVSGGSQCLSCGASLKWYDLLPLVSYVALRGRCRHCHARLYYQYPLVELATGVLFIAVLHRSGLLLYPDAQGIVVLMTSLVFWCVALVIAGYDARHKIIPDELSFALGGVGVVMALLDGNAPFVLSIASGAGAAAFYALLWAVSRGRWMGLGDAKLAFGLGVFLGWPLVVMGNLFGFWVGAAWGIVFMLAGSYTRKSELPFGPFLIIGAFIAYYGGAEILEWYMAFVGL